MEISGLGGKGSLVADLVEVYRLRGSSLGKERLPRQESGRTPQRPSAVELAQNYPNPCSSATEIRYQLPQACHVTLTVHNLRGQLVRTLVEAELPGGARGALGRQGPAMASGLYLYQIRAGSFIRTKKMLYLR